MKKILSTVLVVAVSLVLGTHAQAQDKSKEIPAIAAVPAQDAGDSQASPSDQVLVPGQIESDVPVAPVEAGAGLAPGGAIATSDCQGCGKAGRRPLRSWATGCKTADCCSNACQTGSAGCFGWPASCCSPAPAAACGGCTAVSVAKCDECASTGGRGFLGRIFRNR